MYIFENFILSLYFDFYKYLDILILLIILDADNTHSCTYESHLRITWFDGLKELQEFLITCEVYRFCLKSVILIEKI